MWMSGDVLYGVHVVVAKREKKEPPQHQGEEEPIDLTTAPDLCAWGTPDPGVSHDTDYTGQ